MTKLQALTTGNPMMAEANRAFRRYFDIRRPGLARLVVVTMGLAIFAMTTLAEYLDFATLIFMVLFVICFLAPALLHSSIAGERERRSWDFLLAAPVSHGQIVMGKFVGGALALLIFVAAWIPPMARSIDKSLHDPFRPVVWNTAPEIVALTSITFCIAFGWLLLAMTLFFSARARRAMTALGTTMGLLFIGLFVLPGFTSMIGGDDSMNFIILAFNPMALMGQYISTSTNQNSTEYLISPWLTTAVYLGLTAMILFWTERTLRFADNTVKFVQGKKNA